MKPKDIAMTIDCSVTTVYTWVRKWKENKGLERSSYGKRKKTTEQEDEALVYYSLQNPFKTSLEIKKELNLTASARTIRRRLCDMALHERIIAKKLSLTPHHLDGMMKFAEEREEHKDGRDISS